MAVDIRNRVREDHYGEHGNGRSVAELIRELRDETTRLFRDEVALAKTEMTDKASRAGRNVGYLAVGGAIAYAGAMVLLMAAVVGLYVAMVAFGVSHATAGWLSPLILGLVVVGIGYAMVQKAISTLKDESLTPERTVETMQDNKNWIKQKVS